MWLLHYSMRVRLPRPSPERGARSIEDLSYVDRTVIGVGVACTDYTVYRRIGESVYARIVYVGPLTAHTLQYTESIPLALDTPVRSSPTTPSRGPTK
jgi:hypothetical protein